MPKTTVIFCLLFYAFSGQIFAAPAVDYYAPKYDHIDVEKILNNRRMVNYYAACFLSKGPCAPEGLEFKRILPDALRTNCLRCTEKQKATTLKVVRRLKKEYPKIWSQLHELWDPDDVYVQKFEETFGRKDEESELNFNVINNDKIAPEKNNLLENTNSLSTSSSLPSSSITNRFQSTTKVSQILPLNVDTANITTKKPPPPKPNPVIISTSTTTTKQPESVVPLNIAIGSSNQDQKSQSVVPLPTQTNWYQNQPIPPAKFPIVANIGATVSFGDTIMLDIVKGINALGALGTKALATGAEIADAVLNNISVNKHAEIVVKFVKRIEKHVVNMAREKLKFLNFFKFG